MKKLFSLLIVALISSQMYGGTNIKLRCHVGTSTAASTTGGTLTGKVNGSQVFTGKGTSTDAYDKQSSGTKVAITYVEKSGYYFDHWDFVPGGTGSGFSTISYSSDNKTATVTLGIAACEVHAYFIKYLVATFKNGTTKLADVNFKSGETPTYSGTPSKTSTAQYSYTFDGWTNSMYGTTLVTPSSTAGGTYFAHFKENIRSYTITFKNYDNSQLQSNSVNYGVRPSYSGTPTRAEDANYTYEFSGWNDGTTTYAAGAQLPTVSGAATYTAQFTANPKAVTKYEVNFSSTGTGTLTIKDGENELTTGDEVNENKTITIELGAGTHYHLSSLSVKDGSNNDVSLTEVTADAKYTFTLASDVTISAAFEEDTKYAVTILDTENGSISVKDGGTTIKSGDSFYAGTELTVTNTPATTPKLYEFTGWTGTATVVNGTITVPESAITIGANFALKKYTINFKMDDGTDIPNFVNLQIEHGSTPGAPSDITKISDDPAYGYQLAGWALQANATAGDIVTVGEATEDKTYYAVFTQVASKQLKVGAFTNGTVTLSATGEPIVVSEEGGTNYFAAGTIVNVVATPTKGYHFTGWTGVSGDDAQKARIRVTVGDDPITITPSFAANKDCTLDDTKSLAVLNDTIAGREGQTLTITLKNRTFTAGQWATLSVPFTHTMTSTNDVLYNYVYECKRLDLTSGGSSISFDFVRTNDLVANKPYLVVPRENISSVVFYGVKFVDVAENLTFDGNGVSFVSNLGQDNIAYPDFYVGSHSTLYYASSTGTTTIKGFRAFFRQTGGSSAPRRVRIVLDGVEVEKEIAEDGSLEDVQNVRKYMENGRLVIECNGVRMDATGKKIN